MMNQLLFGAAAPFAVAAALYLLRRGRASLGFLVATPLAMAAGALWAIVPDLPRLFGRQELYHRLAQDPRMDLFLFHYTIDRLEIESPLYHLGLALMALLLVAAAWREVRRLEREP